MSDQDLLAEAARQNAALELREHSPEAPAEHSASAGHYADLQSAVRFPIKLPIFVKSKSGESCTQSDNVSCNGVLFHLDAEVPVGSPVEFTITLPAEVVGAGCDVRVDCRGRVVRSFSDEGRCGVGVVIDEYRFERH